MISSEGKILQSNKASDIFLKGKGFEWFNFWKKTILPSDANTSLLIQCNLKSKPLKNTSLSESTGVTSFYSDKCSFKWIVNKLNSDCSEVIKLPYTGTSQVEISLQVPDDDIKITIRSGEGVTGPKSVMCRITLLDVEDREHDSRQDIHLFEAVDPSNGDSAWEFPTFLKKSILNSEKDKYLKNDSLALKCNLAISNGTQSNSVADKICDSSAEVLSPSAVDISTPDTDTKIVLEDLKRLNKDKIHADVKLQINGEVIFAHKNILAIRSPIFSAMFDTDMVENKTGSVDIPDLDAETVRSLLEYMYTGALEKLDYEVAKKLIVAADKYQVLRLKEKCAEFLISIQSHANACEVLVIADLIQHQGLKAATVNYIKDNSEHVFVSEEWRRVVEMDLHLATETVNKVSELIAASQKKTKIERENSKC